MVKTRASERPLLWLGLWFVCNLLITLGTKGTFRTHGFTFPRTLTLVHMLFTSVLSNIAVFMGCDDGSAERRGGSAYGHCLYNGHFVPPKGVAKETAKKCKCP